jgi:tRNA threonylcarbamoyladenosine biosynthesis protein TsaB
LIIDEHSYERELKEHRIVFFGDGALKCRDMLEPKGMKFIDDLKPSAAGLALLSFKKFRKKEFEDLAYFEPYYLKDFIAGKPRVKGLE